MEKMYQSKVNGKSVYYIEVDKKIIIISKSKNNNTVIKFIGDVPNNNVREEEFIITKEDFEIYSYFERLFNDFKLEEMLNSQITIDQILKEYQVEYISRGKSKEDSTKLGMNKDKDTITIHVSNRKNDTANTFTVVADHTCYPINNLYKNLEENYNPYHQIHFEELLFKERTRTK